MDAHSVTSRLRELEEAGSLPNQGGRLCRVRLAESFGLPDYAFLRSQPVKKYFQHLAYFDAFEIGWNERRIAQFRERLKTLYKAGDLPIARGKISRKLLEKQLGLPVESTAVGDLAEVVDRFNEWLRDEEGRGLVWEEKAPLVRAWLEKRALEGTIPTNHWGLLNKSAILRDFGLSCGRVSAVVKRAPKLGELFREFEERIAPDREGKRYRYSRLADMAERLLDENKIKLVHGRIVSLVDLARQLSVSVSAIKTTPALKALVDKKQIEINSELRTGYSCKTFRIAGVNRPNIGAKPYSEKHRRIFDFSPLIDGFGIKFCELVGTSFHQLSQELADGSDCYRQLLKFLNWVLLHKAQFSSLIESMRNAGEIDRDTYERMFLDYRADCISDALDAGKVLGATAIPVLEKLGDLDVFPPVRHLRKSKKSGSKKDCTHRPSLAEAQAEERSVVGILVDTARYRGLSIAPGKDAKAFAETIIWEKKQRDDLPEDLAEAILTICEGRLEALQSAASQAFNAGMAALHDGDRLILQAKYSGSEIAERINLNQGRTAARRRAVAELFPIAERKVALANMAALVRHEYNNVCPDGSEHFGFFARQYLKIGGAIGLQNLLAPSARMMAAGLLLYMAESGANPSVATTLKVHPWEDSSVPGHKRVLGYKARGNKVIVDDLPNHHGNGLVSAVEALEILSARSVRLTAAPDLLATFALGGEVRPVTATLLRSELAIIKKSHALLSRLHIVPSMLRPTKLLAVQLRNPSDLGIAQMIAQHESERTTQGYVGKLPYRLILDSKIREFTDTLQVVLSTKLNGAQEKLGFSGVRWQELLENGRKTGLGVFCSNPKDSPQADVAMGETCLKLDRCVTCPRKVVVAEPESIADMLLWREGLQRAEPFWLEDRIERWEKVWLPWQAFFHVVLEEKMSRGEFVGIKQEAQAIVDRRKVDPGFRLVEPW